MITILFPVGVCFIAFALHLNSFRRRSEAMLRRRGADTLTVEWWGLASACTAATYVCLQFIVISAVRLLSLEFGELRNLRSAPSTLVAILGFAACAGLAGAVLLRRSGFGGSRFLSDFLSLSIMAGMIAWCLKLFRKFMYHEVFWLDRPIGKALWIGALVSIGLVPMVYERIAPRLRLSLRLPSRRIMFARAICGSCLAAAAALFLHDIELRYQFWNALAITAVVTAARATAMAVVDAAKPDWSIPLQRALSPGWSWPPKIAAALVAWLRPRFDRHSQRSETERSLRSPIQMACLGLIVIVPGEKIVVGWTALHGFALLIATTWFALRMRPLNHLLRWEMSTDIVRDSPSRRSVAAAGAFGFVVVIAGLVCLLIREPFYFTSDDNLSQFLPVIEHGCEVLFRGEFPAWNPYQYLGMPTTSYGTYALTYPGTWASYYLARDVWGDPHATIEIFCIVHLLLGYWAAYVLGLRLEIAPLVAAATAVCFALSGFFLCVGRSWYYIAPTCLYLPLLALFVERLRHGRVGWPWIVGCGLTTGLYFHAGNAQMWLYAMIFMALEVGLLAATRAIGWKRCLPVVCGWLLGAAIVAPLALVQAGEINGLERTPYGEGFLHAWSALIFPPTHSGGPSRLWCEEAFYSGSVFSALALVVLGIAIVFRWRREEVIRWRYVAPAALATIWAIGPTGWCWALIAKIPPFNAFTNPCKLFAWVNFYFLFIGAMAVMRIKSKRSQAGLASAAMVLIFYHATTLPCSFYEFGFKPYESPLDVEVVRKLAGARSYSSAAERSHVPDYMGTLRHNFPTVLRISAAEGYYDNIFDTGPWFAPIKKRLALEDPATLNEYGIRWVVRAPEVAGEEGWTEVATTSEGTIWDTNSTRIRPEAFSKLRPAVGLPVAYRGAGLDVDLAALDAPGEVTVNFHYRPLWRAELDGVPIEIRPDELSRMVVDSPRGAKSLQLRYTPPWSKGLCVGVVCVALAAGLMLAIRLRFSES